MDFEMRRESEELLAAIKLEEATAATRTPQNTPKPLQTATPVNTPNFPSEIPLIEDTPLQRPVSLSKCNDEGRTCHYAKEICGHMTDKAVTAKCESQKWEVMEITAKCASPPKEFRMFCPINQPVSLSECNDEGRTCHYAKVVCGHMNDKAATAKCESQKWKVMEIMAKCASPPKKSATSCVLESSVMLVLLISLKLL